MDLTTDDLKFIIDQTKKELQDLITEYKISDKQYLSRIKALENKIEIFESQLRQ
jgi:hypothetical protein